MQALKTKCLSKRRVLITAGPTWEAIDPVRGISNHSSGKMGYAIAIAAHKAGAEVTLVSGPVCLNKPTGIETILVESAQQMYDAVHAQIKGLTNGQDKAQNKTSKIDIFIGVAAVADYRPTSVQTQKIKKSADEISLKLIKNPDIVASVAALTENRPYTVGFAAETKDLIENARSKLIAKELDLIVANDVSEAGVGFASDQNRICLLKQNRTKKIQTTKFDKQSKTELAVQLISYISEQLP